MLQQLHGVTMYSHDEHHTSAPYCWSERGKGASATMPSTGVLLVIIRPSISQYVSPSCGPVLSQTCLGAVGPVLTSRPGVVSSLLCTPCRWHTFFSYNTPCLPPCQKHTLSNCQKCIHSSLLCMLGFAPICSCRYIKSALWVALSQECRTAFFLILNNSEMQQYRNTLMMEA